MTGAKPDTTDWGVRDAKRRILLADFLRYGTDDRRWSRATQRVYAYWLSRFIDWLAANGRPGIDEATRQDVRDFYNTTKNTVATRQLVQKALRGYYTWLMDEDVRPDNPAARLPRMPVAKRVPKALTADQAAHALEAARIEGPRTYAAVACMLYAGLRAGEVCGLPWEALEDSRWLRVIGKGNRERVLPVHPELATALAAWQKVAPVSRWMFPAPRDEDRSMDYKVSRYMVRKVGQAIGLPALHPHQFRHTYGTELMNATGDLALTQDAMGHATPATTRIYAQVRPARLVAAIGHLDFTGGVR